MPREKWEIQADLPDGIYRVERSWGVAAFWVRNGVVMGCAPILRNNIEWWVKTAENALRKRWEDREGRWEPGS